MLSRKNTLVRFSVLSPLYTIYAIDSNFISNEDSLIDYEIWAFIIVLKFSPRNSEYRKGCITHGSNTFQIYDVLSMDAM